MPRSIFALLVYAIIMVSQTTPTPFSNYNQYYHSSGGNHQNFYGNYGVSGKQNSQYSPWPNLQGSYGVGAYPSDTHWAGLSTDFPHTTPLPFGTFTSAATSEYGQKKYNFNGYGSLHNSHSSSRHFNPEKIQSASQSLFTIPQKPMMTQQSYLGSPGNSEYQTVSEEAGHVYENEQNPSYQTPLVGLRKAPPDISQAQTELYVANNDYDHVPGPVVATPPPNLNNLPDESHESANNYEYERWGSAETKNLMSLTDHEAASALNEIPRNPDANSMITNHKQKSSHTADIIGWLSNELAKYKKIPEIPNAADDTEEKPKQQIFSEPSVKSTQYDIPDVSVHSEVADQQVNEDVDEISKNEESVSPSEIDEAVGKPATTIPNDLNVEKTLSSVNEIEESSSGWNLLRVNKSDESFFNSTEIGTPLQVERLVTFSDGRSKWEDYVLVFSKNETSKGISDVSENNT